MQYSLPSDNLCPNQSRGASCSLFSDSFVGKTIMVVGGDPRPEAVSKTSHALGLGRVEWVPTSERHPSGRAYAKKAHAIKPDMIVVLIGLMRHQQVKDALNFCREQGIKCIPLFRSFSAAQLSYALESQRYSQ